MSFTDIHINIDRLYHLIRLRSYFIFKDFIIDKLFIAKKLLIPNHNICHFSHLHNYTRIKEPKIKDWLQKHLLKYPYLIINLLY